MLASGMRGLRQPLRGRSRPEGRNLHQQTTRVGRAQPDLMRAAGIPVAAIIDGRRDARGLPELHQETCA